MKILFIIIGPVSLKSSHLTRNFIKQLEGHEDNIYVMGDELTISNLDLKNVALLPTYKSFNESLFKKIVEDDFDLIVMVNTDFLLFDDSKLPIKQSFFKYFKCPILFLVSGSEIVFRDNCAVLNGTDKKVPIPTKFYVVKNCPPNVPDMDDTSDNDKNVTIFYWKNLEQFAFLNKDESRDKLQKLTKSSNNIKNVSIIFDLEQMLHASSLNLNYHYKIVIDCVYKYLSNLNIECNLFLGNIAYPNFEQTNPKVKLVTMGALSDSDNDLLIRGSDLIITESIASTILTDAANVKIPVITLKNTLTYSINPETNNLDLNFNFDELTVFSTSKISELITNCPEAIFGYYAFPNPAHNFNFSDRKIFGRYIFTFSDLFDENGTTKTIEELLLKEENMRAERYRIEQYIDLRSEALEASEILDKI